MRSRAMRVSRVIVHLYPRAWRDRYSEEMLALIDESGVTWSRASDLAVGCLDAWLRKPLLLAFIWPLLGAVLVRTVTNTAISFSIVPTELWRFKLARLFVFVYLPVILRSGWIFVKAQLMAMKVLPESKDVGLSSRVVRVLSAATLIVAIGADFSRFPGSDIPTIPIMTFNALLFLQQSSKSFLSAARLYREGRRKRH